MMRRKIRVTLGCMLAVAALGGTAEAGYIFMKNGYIIQGRIVDKSDEQIVLRWNEGDMTIHQRFVLDVVLDGSEEEDLRQLEEIRNSAKQEAVPAAEQALEKDIQLELPEHLEDLVPGYHKGMGTQPMTSAVVDVTPLAPSSGAEKAPPGGDSETTVTRIDPAAAIEQVYEDAALAWTFPAGWKVERFEGGLYLTCAADSNVTAVVCYQRETLLPLAEADAVLSKALVEGYAGLKISKRESTTMGGVAAMKTTGSLPERAKEFCCYQVQNGSLAYLLVFVSGTDSRPEYREQLDRILASVRFLEK